MVRATENRQVQRQGQEPSTEGLSAPPSVAGAQTGWAPDHASGTEREAERRPPLAPGADRETEGPPPLPPLLVHVARETERAGVGTES